MTIRIPLAALALIALPGLAGAWECGGKMKETAALSCAAGHVWDEARGICVLPPSS